MPPALMRRQVWRVRIVVHKLDVACKVIRQNGALPRKTFSMGDADEKRYYLECRQLS